MPHSTDNVPDVGFGDSPEVTPPVMGALGSRARGPSAALLVALAAGTATMTYNAAKAVAEDAPAAEANPPDCGPEVTRGSWTMPGFNVRAEARWAQDGRNILELTLTLQALGSDALRTRVIQLDPGLHDSFARRSGTRDGGSMGPELDSRDATNRPIRGHGNAWFLNRLLLALQGRVHNMQTGSDDHDNRDNPWTMPLPARRACPVVPPPSPVAPVADSVPPPGPAEPTTPPPAPPQGVADVWGGEDEGDTPPPAAAPTTAPASPTEPAPPPAAPVAPPAAPAAPIAEGGQVDQLPAPLQLPSFTAGLTLRDGPPADLQAQTGAPQCADSPTLPPFFSLKDAARLGCDSSVVWDRRDPPDPRLASPDFDNPIIFRNGDDTYIVLRAKVPEGASDIERASLQNAFWFAKVQHRLDAPFHNVEFRPGFPQMMEVVRHGPETEKRRVPVILTKGVDGTIMVSVLTNDGMQCEAPLIFPALAQTPPNGDPSHHYHPATFDCWVTLPSGDVLYFVNTQLLDANRFQAGDDGAVVQRRPLTLRRARPDPRAEHPWSRNRGHRPLPEGANSGHRQ